MTVDEMEILSRLRDVPPLPDAASARARVVLQAAVVVDDRKQVPWGTPRRPARGRAVGLLRRHPVPAGAAAVVVAAALVAGGMALPGLGASRRPGAGSAAGSPTTGTGTTRDVLDRLASAAVDVPAPAGRYVVLSETDTETGYPGQLRRTSVVDTVTGASTTYQQAYSAAGAPVPNSTYHAATAAGTWTSTASDSAAAAAKQAAADAAASTPGPPPRLTAGADPTQTAAWFASLPTTPAALRAKLLALATQPSGGIAPALDPTFTSDDYVYQEADTMLWSPVISPALRSALYKVLANTSGYTISSGTDPAGRPAVVMTRAYSGAHETDITYEDPSTGAVLAQVWKVGKDVISAVYQPVTASTSPPTDPYTS